MTPKPKALFIHATDAPDLREDLAILREAYAVESFFFDAKRARSARGLATLLRRQAAWLRRHLPGAALVYGCFADYHLALPAWLAPRAGVPLAVRLGGYDANHLPELGYGVFDSRWRAPLARIVLRRAALLLPVAEALIESRPRYATWPEPRRQGVRAHVPGLTTPHVTVPLGFAVPAVPPGDAARPRSILCVALLDSRRTIRIKGVDVLIEAARHLARRGDPARIRIVGVLPGARAALDDGTLPVNVTLEPPVPHAELGDIYRSASVYAQASRTEGMPNVVAEAMLSGCIPVTSAVGAMPDMVAGVGLVVERPDAEVWADRLAEALAASPAERESARARVQVAYPRTARSFQLRAALSGMLARRSLGTDSELDG